MEEEKNRERKERIDTIFMYESRIKGNLLLLIHHWTIRALLMMWSANVRTSVLWNIDYFIRFMTFIRDLKGLFHQKSVAGKIIFTQRF